MPGHRLTRQEIAERIFDLEQKDRHDPRDRAELEDLRRARRELPEEPRPTYALLLATPDRFRAWLQGQPADRAFKPRKTCACPLAEFLGDLAGGSPQVTGHSVWPLRDQKEEIDLPCWAVAFVDRVDNLGAGPVYPGQCIGILRKQEAGV